MEDAGKRSSPTDATTSGPVAALSATLGSSSAPGSSRPASTSTSSVVPMPSVRIGDGRYEVVGTSNAVECFRERSYWWLMIDGDRETAIGPFQTKRSALQYAQESPEL